LRLVLDATTECVERRAADKVHMVTGPWIVNILRLLLGHEALDAARREAAGQESERVVDAIVEAVGDRDRVEEAFDRVRIVPLETAWEWIAKPANRPLYKQGEAHWKVWNKGGRPIFR